MAGMIYYAGKALEEVAPVKVEDIRVSPIQLSAVARQRPEQFGADFVRITGGTRTAAITFAVHEDDLEKRQRYLTAITAWARRDSAAALSLPGHDGVYLEAVCTGLPEPSLRQWWEAKLRLVFTCFDNPYWTSIEQKSATLGSAITVLGDAPPLMEIRRTLTGSASNQTYSNGTESMTFSTVPAGNLVIDLNKQTAAVSGTSIMQYYPLTGATFLRPRTGTYTITGNGSVYWRERWE